MASDNSFGTYKSLLQNKTINVTYDLYISYLKKDYEQLINMHNRKGADGDKTAISKWKKFLNKKNEFFKKYSASNENKQQFIDEIEKNI